jgi:hypothetical protein
MDNGSRVVALSPKRTLLALSEYHRDGERIELRSAITDRRIAVLSGHGRSSSAFAFSPDDRWLASASDDTSILIWDVERLWRQHVVSEILTGNVDVRILELFPEQGVPTVQERLTHFASTERRVRQLIKDLDDDPFAVREKATQDLRKMGAEAGAFLRHALSLSPSAEVRARAQRLLQVLDVKEIEKTLDRAKVRKVVMLLSSMKTRPARQALNELANLDPETIVATEARRALEALRSSKSK